MAKPYWLFLIKSRYIEKIPIPYMESTNTYLYAYTDNKDYVKEFFKLRTNKYFKVKKKMMSREDIHLLTINFQSYMLKKLKFSYKDVPGGIKLVVTDKEHYIATNQTYVSLMKLCDLQISSLDKLNLKYYNTIKRLEYEIILDDEYDDPFIKFSPDILSSYIHIFKSILK